ncbi:hypothetical protein [Kribbella sp. ALI-6-A]|nr:hypothetical protein [Kribbella sp. ALI-6-A]
MLKATKHRRGGRSPALVWVAAVVFQYVVLAPRLIPFFEGPPA